MVRNATEGGRGHGGPIRSGCGEYHHGCVDIGKMWLLITIGNWEPVPCPVTRWGTAINMYAE